MEFSTPLTHALERALDGYALRHEAIANNIANVNTPGYVRQEVNFEATLHQAMLDESAPRGFTEDPLGDQGLGTIDGFTLHRMLPANGALITDEHNHALITWQPKMSRSGDPAQRLDGNRTPIETEMSAMVQNATKFQAVGAVVTKEFSILRTIAQAK